MFILKFELCCYNSRQGMLDYITVQLAPRAADEIWNGVDNVIFIPFLYSIILI